MENIDNPIDLYIDTAPDQDDPHLLSAADPLWTVEDVACYLKLQPETIRAMARRGKLPALKIGKVWRFQKNAIHNLIISLE